MLKGSYAVLGPGARKKVIGVPFTRRTMVQLYILKLEYSSPPHNKTWQDTADFVNKIFTCDVPVLRMKYIIESSTRFLLRKVNSEEITSFLNETDLPTLYKQFKRSLES
jgi:hypothetical protein